MTSAPSVYEGAASRGTFRFWTCAVLLSLAMVLGGGGTSNPATELALELATALLLGIFALVLLMRPASVGDARVPRTAWALAAFVVALPVLQLVPLPPSLWQSLPGREPAVAALELAGAPGAWMPLSLTPSRTLASMLALGPPLALLLLASGLDLAERRRLLWVVLAFGGASIVLGALQIGAGAGGGWHLYGFTHQGNLVGFQASRNAQADILLLVLLAVPALAGFAGSRQAPLAPLVIPAVLLVVISAILLTSSRAGIALTPVALVFVAAALWPRIRRAGMPLVMAGAGGLALLTAALVALRPGASAGVFARFINDSGGRSYLWEDTAFAIAQHWPAGSGLGSFVPVFLAAERLEYVDASHPVRAHNDWLEYTLEGGLPGLVLLAAVLALLALAAWRSRPHPPSRDEDDPAFGADRRVTWLFALGSFTVLALHAIVDYPMRSMAIACLAALAAAMVVGRGHGKMVRGSR